MIILTFCDVTVSNLISMFDILLLEFMGVLDELIEFLINVIPQQALDNLQFQPIFLQALAVSRFLY